MAPEKLVGTRNRRVGVPRVAAAARPAAVPASFSPWTLQSGLLSLNASAERSSRPRSPVAASLSREVSVRFRHCVCGQLVEQRHSECPYCGAEMAAEPAHSLEKPVQEAPPAEEAPLAEGTPPVQEAPPSPAAERTDWYYMYEGHMVGPCTTELLQASVASGLLAGDTQIWAPGMKEWTTLGQIIEVPDGATPSRPAAEPAAGAGAAVAPAAAAVAGDPLAPAVEEPVFGDEPPAEEPALAASTATESHPDSYAPAAEADADDLDASLVAVEPHPWLRWFARIVDLTITAFVLGMVAAILAPSSTIFDNSLASSIIVLLVWMVVEPFVLTHFENTPGKALLNIRLQTADGRSLKLDQAFQRSARVWFFGMGAGLPIVSLITMVVAYNKLKNEGITSWDREGDLSVTHGPIGTGRMVTIGLFIGFYVLLNIISAIA
jgi:hypothetical protein